MGFHNGNIPSMGFSSYSEILSTLISAIRQDDPQGGNSSAKLLLADFIRTHLDNSLELGNKVNLNSVPETSQHSQKVIAGRLKSPIL
ncbi:hypothetical protein J1TS3_00390 [Siminovitchia fordii]|uniref:Uncharacterized protein n=1 Tax=Siminovitchia fordii TaxID=254759 RepID=A0ABQ4K1Q4_9BACI|nr:hypothetical protein J1TS3_00390 [Siminovitchia fordii]